MAKVLISFLGTGGLKSSTKENTKQSEQSEREYRTARYKLNDNEYEHTFIAAALAQHHNIDKIILIGTVHSMWEEVYRHFQQENGMEINENDYFEIGEHCEKANNKSDLYIPHQEKIEHAIGKKAKIVLIKYGLSEEEIKENINIVLGIENELEGNDEVIVDITHSFRSLPILIMNLLIYLRNVSKKGIRISHVHYGMLEVSKELNHAPITELSEILKINDWIKGAYAFENYGNAYQIADLIEPENKSVSKRLRKFSDLMNLNHLASLQKEINSLKAIQEEEYNSIMPKLIITPIIKEFINNFGNIKKQSVFQLKLAQWQYNNYNFSSAYISMQEAIITFVCEQNNKKHDVLEERDEAKKELKKKDSQWKIEKELSEVFKRIKDIRNSLAHSSAINNTHNSSVNRKKKEPNREEIIAILKKSLVTLSKIIK